jgi:hypothetical protein
MTNPQLADKIVSAMIELKTGHSLNIAKHIKEPHEAVMEVMRYFESAMPQSFQGTKGYGDAIDIFIKVSAEATMKEFMKGGGFTAQYQRQQQEAASRDYKEKLEVLNLEQTMKTARFSNRLAWASLIISGIVAAVEIIKFIMKID